MDEGSQRAPLDQKGALFFGMTEKNPESMGILPIQRKTATVVTGHIFLPPWG